jgi:hypothetical protein
MRSRAALRRSSASGSGPETSVDALILPSRRSMSTGLVSKSEQPTSRLLSRSLSSVWAVKAMIGILPVAGLPFMCWVASQPSISPSATSIRMTSGSSLAAMATAVGPLIAHVLYHVAVGTFCQGHRIVEVDLFKGGIGHNFSVPEFPLLYQRHENPQLRAHIRRMQSSAIQYLKKPVDLVARHGSAVEVSLGLDAAFEIQAVHLRLGLDTLCGGGHAKTHS